MRCGEAAQLEQDCAEEDAVVLSPFRALAPESRATLVFAVAAVVGKAHVEDVLRLGDYFLENYKKMARKLVLNRIEYHCELRVRRCFLARAVDCIAQNAVQRLRAHWRLVPWTLNVFVHTNTLVTELVHSILVYRVS